MSSPEQSLYFSEQSKRERNRIRSESLLSNFLIPADIHDPSGSLEKIHTYASQGYGLVVAVNHFSLRDGPAAFTYIVGKEPEYLNKRWLAPIAYHQHSLAKKIDAVLGTGIELVPIVTNDTLTHEKFSKMERGDGTITYLRKAESVLGEGGVAVVFPQVGRRATLGVVEEENKVMDYLCRLTDKKGNDRILFLPVGFGIEGTVDYSRARGPHLFERYEVNIGPVILKKEALQSANSSNQSIDQWMFSQIRPLVPESYR